MRISGDIYARVRGVAIWIRNATRTGITREERGLILGQLEVIEAELTPANLSRVKISDYSSCE